MISPSLDESAARLDLGDAAGKRGSPEQGSDIPRLPTRINGGFRGLTEDVERRIRELGVVSRALE
jgi:hypothetical protein